MSDSIPDNLTQCAFNFDELNSQPAEQPVYELPKLQITPQKQCVKCTKYFPATAEFFHRNKRKKDGFHQQCKICKNTYLKVHRSLPEVQEHTKAYREIYSSRPGAKEIDRARGKAYRSRPEVQERIKAYRNHPEIQERKRDWEKAHIRRTDVQERRKAYLKDYYSRPGVQEHRRAQIKAHRSLPEIQKQRQTEKKAYISRPEIQERNRMHAHNRRSLQRSIQGTYTPQQIQELLIRQKHQCYYCSTKFGRRGKQYIYHIDHTFPISRVAGTNIPANSIGYLVLACPTCNMSKGDKFPWEWPEGGRLV